MPSFQLTDRVAVVTGALGLIGRTHCHALAEAGAHVVVADLNADACTSLAHSLEESHGRPALAVAVDVTEEDQVVALRDAVLQRFGAIDALVTDAAIDDKFENPANALERSRFENYPVEAFRRMLDVNVTGTFLCCQALGEQMAKQGRGSIVTIASTYGVVAPQQSLYRRPDGTQAFYKCAAYPTSKGAVLAFSRFLAAYFGPSGVRVNSLSPGGVENGQSAAFVEAYSARTPLGRMADKSDLGAAVVFLASDASSYMTGANLVIDGGWTAW